MRMSEVIAEAKDYIGGLEREYRKQYKVRKKNTPEAEEIYRRIAENGGYCCCATVKEPDTVCICKDFRDKINDHNFFGECHCGLYEKVEVKHE